MGEGHGKETGFSRRGGWGERKEEIRQNSEGRREEDKRVAGPT
jgi:hypothetical protein